MDAETVDHLAMEFKHGRTSDIDKARDVGSSTELDPPVLKQSPVSKQSPVLKWAIVGFLLAMILLLMPTPLNGRVGSAVSDLAHAPFFGGICIVSVWLWNHTGPIWSFGSSSSVRIFVIAMVVFLAGIAIEFMQSLTGRITAMHDVVANGLGIMAACSLCIGTQRRADRPNDRWLTSGCIILATVLMGVATARPAMILWDVWAVRRAFPVINSFESSRDVSRWYLGCSSVALVDTHVTDGRHAMRWSLLDAEHPSITLTETVPDWSAVESLELDVTLSPDFPGRATLLVKVMDGKHADYHEDVCRKEFLLNPGESRHLSVGRAEMINGPDTRKLNLSNVKLLSLVVYRPGAPTWIDVDAIYVKLRD